MFTCRECEYEINQGTEICPHCGTDLTLPPPGEPVVRKKLTVRQILVRWAFLIILLVGTIWGFLWFVASPRTGAVTQQAEAHAVQALDDIHALLSSYAAVQNGVYPKTLEPLGALARQAAQMAQADGYAVEYTPGPTDTNAAIRSYTLEARPDNYGYRSFYTDVSGLIRATREDRPATSSDPPIQ